MKTVLLASASLLGLSLSFAPRSASADSLSDLKLQMSIIESQVQTLQSHAARQTPDDRAALEDVQREVAALKTQMAQVQAQQLAPAQVQVGAAPAPMRQSRAPLTALTGGTGPIPLIGGIPIVNSPRGAFFVAGTIDGGLRLDSGTHTHSVFGVQSGLMRASRLTLEGYLNLAEAGALPGSSKVGSISRRVPGPAILRTLPVARSPSGVMPQSALATINTAIWILDGNIRRSGR